MRVGANHSVKANEALVIPLCVEEPDKIGFEPMVLDSTVYFKYTTFDHSVIYPKPKGS